MKIIKIAFWAYNGLFYIPFVLGAVLLLRNWADNVKDTAIDIFRFSPTNLLVLGIFLFFTPIISIILVRKASSTSKINKYSALLFGFEMPVLSLTILRLVLIRQMNASMWLIYLTL